MSTPRRGSPRPWSESEDAFLLDSPHLRSREIGEVLGRTRTAVKHRRRKIGAPVWRWPAWAVGTRRLLAKTCIGCGLLLDDSWFYRNYVTNRWEQHCIRCRPSPLYDGVDRHRREDGAVLAQARTRDQATRSGEEYTSADMEVLSRPDLSLEEMAVLLGRTYNGVVDARSRFGFADRASRGEPVESWIVRPAADVCEASS